MISSSCERKSKKMMFSQQQRARSVYFSGIDDTPTPTPAPTLQTNKEGV